MADTNTQSFHVQSTINDSKTFPYHESVSSLWQQKWRKPASMGIYPFVDGKVEDFDPIFEELRKTSNDDPSILYDPDAYAKPFFPVAENLVAEAQKAEKSGGTDEARDLYLRAGAVYRMARFPINRSTLSQKAWEDGKKAYMAASPYLNPPNTEVSIPFTHASASAGESKDSVIPAYLRVPAGSAPKDGWPVLLFICGLDAYRTDHTDRTDAHCKRGFAVLSLEIPGAGDSPAARKDPESPDRQFASILDWIYGSGKARHQFNTARVVARGVSTGGYYAIRVAHTEPERLFAVVAQGGGSHWMFDERWIKAQNHMEYPFALADALAYKFGYDSVDGYAKEEPIKKFSLLESGLLDKQSARLLVINGMEDSIFPIEDSMLTLKHGRVKEARFVESRGHMGNPGAEDILYDWIDEVMQRS